MHMFETIKFFDMMIFILVFLNNCKHTKLLIDNNVGYLKHM